MFLKPVTTFTVCQYLAPPTTTVSLAKYSKSTNIVQTPMLEKDPLPRSVRNPLYSNVRSSRGGQGPMFFKFAEQLSTTRVLYANLCITTFSEHRSKSILSRYLLRSTVRKPLYNHLMINQQQEATTHVLQLCSAGICYVELYAHLYETPQIKKQQQVIRTHVLLPCPTGIST